MLFRVQIQWSLILLVTAITSNAWAQPANSVQIRPVINPLAGPGIGRQGMPNPTYYKVFPFYNDGDFRSAAKGFENARRGGALLGGVRWIDSI